MLFICFDMAPSLASLNLSHFYSGERESIIHQRLFFLLLLLFLKKERPRLNFNSNLSI